MPTESFLSLFTRAAGRCEIPSHYFTFSCISLLAAALNDHVWVEKFIHKPLYPNLYTFIVGPSSTGKDTATDLALDLLQEEDDVFVWAGKLSGAGLADIMGKQKREARPSVYLVLPEVSMSIGEGALAKDFIKRLTGQYGTKNYKYREATRTSLSEGTDIEYASPIYNGIFGSTMMWLLDAVTKQDIESGFFGRCLLTLQRDYNFDLRITDPEASADHDAIIHELRRRLHNIMCLEGEFQLTEKAAQIRDRWYQDRPAPEDSRLAPSWKRQDDMCYKLGMIFSRAVQYDETDLLINAEAIKLAQAYSSQSMRAVPELLKWAGQTKETVNLETVAEAIQRAERIPHSSLLKKVTKRGIHARDLAIHMQHLLSEGRVAIDKSSNGARVYEWKGR